MEGKTVVITGGNAGIGKETAIGLAKKGANVTITGRNEEKVKAAVEEIKQKSGNGNVDYLICDQASLDNVRKLAETINAKYDKIDVLVNNAGLYTSNREFSKDGIELMFAVNHLSHFLLTNLVLDKIKAAKGRIVSVASVAHKDVRDFDASDLNMDKDFSGWKGYGRSKWCNIVFTKGLAKRLEGTGVTANCLHPGGVSTEIAQKEANWYTKLGWWLGRQFYFISAEEGAQTSIYLASSDEVKDVSGEYFYKSKKVFSNRPSQDPEMAEKLWEVSERLAPVDVPAEKASAL